MVEPMKKLDPDVYNWPNLVSMIRILMAPVMMILAIEQQYIWFFIAMLFTGFTDVLDGFLARQLNQVTALGSRLDSWGDFIIYSTLAVAAWLMWPAISSISWPGNPAASAPPAARGYTRCSRY